MRAAAIALAVALLHAVTPVRADIVPFASLGGGYMVLGGRNPTSEWVLSGRGGAYWEITDGFALHGSAVITGAPDITDHWAIGLAGLDIGTEYIGESGWLVNASVRGEYGRVPICNDWPGMAICMRYWGVVPGGTIAAGKTFSSKDRTIAVLAGATVRIIDALPGTHPSWQPFASALWWW